MDQAKVTITKSVSPPALVGDKEKVKSPTGGVRKRRAHRKSRGGCANCKIRRVKCDEAKPSCARCVSFSLTCSYTAPGSTLTGMAAGYERLMQPAIPVLELDLSGGRAAGVSGVSSFSVAAGAEQPPLPQQPAPAWSEQLPPPPPPQPVLSTPSDPPALALPLADGGQWIVPNAARALIDYFKHRVPLLETAIPTSEYKAVILRLAHEHTWLYHPIMALALVHKDLAAQTQAQSHRPPSYAPSGTAESPTQLAIAMHKFHTSALLNKYISLAPQLPRSGRDALWAAAALLSHILFSAPDAPSPFEAWPIRQPCADDLSWLRMCLGKHAVFDLVQPRAADSAFCAAMRGMPASITPATPAERAAAAASGLFAQAFPSAARAIWDLDGPPGKYHGAAYMLAQCLARPATSANVLPMFAFLRVLDDAFVRLLMDKDMPALVLLAWWYARVVECRAGAVLRRALVEARAICVYVHSWGQTAPDLMKALEYPKRVVGMPEEIPPEISAGLGRMGVSLRFSLKCATLDLFRGRKSESLDAERRSE